MKPGLRSATGWLPEMPRSLQRQGRRLRSLLLFTTLALGLCACTRSIVMIPDAPSCWDYVPAQLVDPTPGAPLPNRAAGSWAAFGNVQTGQLEEANAKPPAIAHIVKTCEAKHAAALAKAERQSRPWWRRL